METFAGGPMFVLMCYTKNTFAPLVDDVSSILKVGDPVNSIRDPHLHWKNMVGKENEAP